MNTLQRLSVLTLLLIVMLTGSAGQFRKTDVYVKTYPSVHSGKIGVNYVRNLCDTTINVRFDDMAKTGPKSQTVTIKKGGSWKGDLTCTAIYARPEGGQFIVIERVPDASAQSTPPSTPSMVQTLTPMSVAQVVSDFHQYIEAIPFYSESAIDKETVRIREYIDSLQNNTESGARQVLSAYARHLRDSLSDHVAQDSLMVTEFLKRYASCSLADTIACVDSLNTILSTMRKQHENNLKRINDELSKLKGEKKPFVNYLNMIIVGVVLLLLIAGLSFWYNHVRKRQEQKQPSPHSKTYDSSSDDNDIVVINTEAPVLRKQSLSDVVGNECYLKVPTSDFCTESAVRNIYIKNTCVKDIYNMYANDLRNPENPKEDGCMVLGRWVFDEGTQLYDVSLEQIVLPGDDAIFAEYELNFGGKIKLKEREMLRRLRTQTDLQYDLTCWVHSHPGLGVFFSSSDNNVHLQLKKPTHPNFLIAIVVDILTPNQELGIFTFRQDSTLNAKPDLTKLYSLEEMYKWAVESQRNAFNPHDYYNTLAQTGTHSDECYGIELSNGAIIDMAQLATEEKVGFVGLVHGFTHRKDNLAEHIAVTVAKSESVPDQELVGCFFIGTHCSIPSVRKAIATWLPKIHFVLVYTPSNGQLTSIPVASGELQGSEKYYGEQTLEELKIWTRRKR